VKAKAKSEGRFVIANTTKLTLILLTWRIWSAPNNANRWQKGFNSAFKGLIDGARGQTYAFARLIQPRSPRYPWARSSVDVIPHISTDMNK